MPLVLGGSSAAAGGFSVDNSCRFDDGASAYMHKTFGAGGATKKWTFSTWFKRGNISSAAPMNLFGGEKTASLYTDVMVGNPIGAGDFLWWKQETGTVAELKTTQVLRDTSWYHIVFVYDSAQAVASDRNIMYLNGARITSFVTETNVAQDVDSYVVSDGDKAYVGVYDASSKWLDGYLAETILIDNQALTPSSFGEFNGDSPTIWQPIDLSDLSVGTQGFYLDYKDSANLGNDASGGTDLTEVNIDATDQATDSPTNNFCVINVLDNFYNGSTFSEGNCQMVTGTTSYTWNTGTIGLSTGKWYWETELDAEPSLGNTLFGVADRPSGAADQELGDLATTYAYLSSGRFRTNNSQTAADYTAFAPNDIVGFALNLDDNEITFYVNGVIVDAARPLTASGTGFYFPAWGDWLDPGVITIKANFGGCSAFTVASANQDANGYGNFEFPVPSGYLAICTKNLGSDGG